MNLRLPTSEELWEAESFAKWYQTRRSNGLMDSSQAAFMDEERRQPTLAAAVAKLHHQLTLDDGTSQFASTVLIHAVIKRSWDVSQYLNGPLYTSESEEHSGSQQAPPATYLASVPSFPRWRNRACDSLDVLHWDALANSAKARGLEGPVFLQLHLARLLLLTPVKELLILTDLQSLDRSVIYLPHQLAWQRLSKATCERHISIWASQDRYKARLAVVHAGAVFWHVRRAVTPRGETTDLARGDTVQDRQQRHGGGSPLQGAHVEPDGANHLVGRASNASQRGLWSRMPQRYDIDRPVDDELVQHFVRKGQASVILKAEGVEDLCTAAGARQILLEAVTILRASNSIWPLSENYALTLEAQALAIT
ncbi:hypothetical protein LTR86_006941 [Recurvomyces mirabilis]|nr:hypothetical protein LTR86_006941 [Recurvomyces mirabilis]